jgi:hypothetical protein
MSFFILDGFPVYLEAIRTANLLSSWSFTALQPCQRFEQIKILSGEFQHQWSSASLFADPLTVSISRAAN